MLERKKNRKRENKKQTEGPILTVPQHGAVTGGLWLSVVLIPWPLEGKKCTGEGPEESSFKQAKEH